MPQVEASEAVIAPENLAALPLEDAIRPPKQPSLLLAVVVVVIVGAQVELLRGVLQLPPVPRLVARALAAAAGVRRLQRLWLL